MKAPGSKLQCNANNKGAAGLVRHPLTALMFATGMLPGWSLANTITPDGTTDTTVDVAGNLSDIHTDTVRGKTGFNSFGDFKVSQGNVVNLHVPGSATHLVNLVNNSRAEINGTLNGVMNNNIGGHIIFADPHGFVVGASGVVNVGSLTVSTPNNAEMQRLRNLTQSGVDADQANALVDELVAGRLAQAQLNGDGSNVIVIEGLINTNGALNLQGASVIVEASGRLQAGTDAARTVFESTVNTQGLSIGTDAVRGDGNIRITAAQDVEIAGELAVLMADDSGASVRIAGNRSVALKGDALVDASGKAGKNAGDVTIEAPSIKVQDDARVVARASGAGTSGDITLNALSDLSCTVCDEDADAQTLDELKSGIENQANPWLSANLGKADISVAENAQLDAGHDDDGARAGDVTLNAFAINRQLAGYAEASALIQIDGSLEGRNISVHADSRAEVARDILGSLLNTDGLKEDIAALKALNNWSEEETWANILDTLYEPLSAYENTSRTDAFLATPTNFTELTLLVPGLAAYIAKADSQVIIGSNADLVASADINLVAESMRTVDSSTWKIPVLGSKIPFGFSAAYGQISGLTAVDVRGGAELEAGRNLSVLAHSTNKLAVTSAAENSVDGNGNKLKTMGLGFGMAMSDIETRAVVEKDVELQVGEDVNVTALTEQNLSNTVSFKASGQGASGGPAIGLSLLDSVTRAEFSADLAGARNLNLTAANLVHEQNLAVTVSAGAAEPGYLDKIKAKAKEQVADPVTNYLGDAVKGLFGITPSPAAEPPAQPTDSKFRLASALGISMADHQVEAVLGSADAAPEISLSGDLSVQALQQQRDLHTSVESKVNASAKRDDGSVDGAAVSLSVAAAYSELDQTSHAIIGDGANVTAGRIGVGAQNRQPLNLQGLDRWSSLEEVYANLKLLVQHKQGIVGKLATQYANSTGEADSLGMAGSLSILQNHTDATAWVGDNVTLTATALDDSAWSSNPLSLLPAIADDEARQALLDLEMGWEAPVSIRAENQLEQLAVSGNFGSLFGSTSDGGAVGAAVNVQMTDNRAVAGIGAGGTINTKALDVSALQDEMIIGLSPSAGKGASVAGNGSVVVSVVDSKVHASVHSSTDVEADRVRLDAEHQLGVWSAAGALASSENAGIGAGVAVNVVNTDVYALVGDNNLLTGGANRWRPAYMSAGLVDASQGSWKVDELTLGAQSSGQSGAFSVAGAMARSEQEQEQQDAVAAESGGADKGSQGKAGSLSEAIKTSLTNGLALLTGEFNAAKNNAVEQGDAAVNKISEYWAKLQGVFDGSDSGSTGNDNPSEGMSLAAAASGSVNVSAQKNRSHLGNIVLDPRNSDAGSQVNVLSLNQTHQFSGAGAGALTLSGGGDKSEFSAALSGAVAFNQLNNLTEAQVRNVRMTDNDLLNVQAASGGDQIALGLGVSVAKGGQTNVAVALSGSAGVFGNQTRASVIDSVINQRASAPGSIAVNAYDRSRNLLGGGAFAVSTDKGGSGGGSFVVGIMQNQLEAEWLGSSATDFTRLEVKANSASRVLAGAVGAAVSTGSQSGAGAGSLFVVVMDNQVKARVDKTAQGDSSLTGGDVTLAAASVSGLDALDSIFAHDAEAAGTLSASGLDLNGDTTIAQIEVESQTNDELFEESDEGFDTTISESDSTADTTTRNLFDSGSIGGEAVLGIAGSLAATGGKAAVGGAFGVVYNGSDYAASITNTDIDLSGDLRLAARNETDVLAGAIGAAGAQNISVSGSATAIIGRGSVSADLDMTGRTLVADDLVVEALKSGGFYSLAGSISASNTVAVGGAFSINDMQQGASALVQGGTYQLGGGATINAAQQSRIITAALSAAVSASGVGVGAAMTYNRIADTTTAELLRATLSAEDLSIAASQPNLGASIWSLAFNLAAGGGSAGVGAGVAVNLIDAERAAKLTDSVVNLDGDLSMTSALDGEIWSIGIDAAGGGTAGVGGSFAFNNISGKDEVSITGSTVTAEASGQSLSLDASAGNGLTIASLAGSVTGGGTAAVGLAASVNRIDADRTALISDSTVNDFASVALKAGVEQAIYSIAVAGGGAGTVAVNGATTTNILDGSERAAVVGSTLDVGSLSLSTAEGKRTIWGLGLVLNGAGSVAVGAANVNNIILAKRIAEIDDSEMTLSGALSLASGGDALIRSAALGGGGAGAAAVGASVAVNLVDGEETARVNDSRVDGASSLVVEVTRGEVDIKTLAGNVQGGGSGAGAGAVAVSTVSQRRQALVQNSELNLSAAAPARVEALTRARIDTLALSGAGAGAAAAVFSNTTNNIDAKTYAQVSNSRGSAGNLQIKATDNSDINSLAGGVAAAGSVAVGVASAVNRIANDIEASLSGQRAGAGFTLNDLGVHARSDASILTASVSGGFSGTAAVNGGVATSILNTGTRALINGGAEVLAQNNVAVVAYNRDVIDSYAAVVAGSGNAAVSGILTVNVVQSDTEAAIRGAATRVTALGLGSGVAVDNGVVTNAPNTQLWADAEEFNPVADLQTGSETIRGLAVRATTLQQAGQMSVSAAVSLVPLASASVGGVSNTSVLGGSTLAIIDQAQINQDNTGASGAQQVSVGAHAHSYSFGGVLNAALSLGAAAVAVTADAGVISRDVTAQVRAATLNSRGATSVKAGSTRSASSIVVSASGAIVGVAGSASVLVLEGSTQALVDGASQLNTGSLAVKASAVNYLSPNAQTVSGGAVGAGAGAGVGYNQSTVRAWLGAQPGESQNRTSVTTSGAVTVEASSLTEAQALSASISGGGAAMAGSVNVLIIENVTEAGLGAVDLSNSGTRAASLKVDAYDRLNVDSLAGSGAGGGLALGASANVLVANNATRARVLDSNLWTSGAVGVTARRESDIALTTITGGVGGSLALGGSIGLIMLGSGTTQVDDSNAIDELNAGDAGTLSMVDGFTERDTADTQYQTLQLNSQTGEYELVTLDNSTETQWLNQQGQIGSSADRFAAGAGDTYKHETLAQLYGGQVNSGGLLTVSATDAIRTQNLVGSLQLSGTAAVGGVVGFTLSNSRVNAELTPVLVNSAGVLVKSDSFNLYNDRPAVLIDAYTGSAGFGVGLGAGVGVALMDNLVTTSLGGAINSTGDLNASARDALDLDVQVKGGQLGAVGAAGIVIGVGERASNVSITVADDARLEATGTLDFAATSEGGSRVKAQGASGGILFGVQAAVVNARDTSTARLTVGERAHVKADMLNLSATAKPRLDAEGLGVAVGGVVSMGGTVLNADASANAYVDLQDNSRLTARSADVRASIERNGLADSVKAQGVGVVGGLGLSANAVVASARNTTSSLLSSADTAEFVGLSGGDWSFTATTDVRQRASTQGVTVGLLSVGAHVAEALADTSTQALLKGRFSGDMGALKVSANALVDNEARSTAGQGGLISGAASLARTRDNSNTKAYLDARGLDSSAPDAIFRQVALSALHQSRYNAFVDSVNASLVGASGAHAMNSVTVNTTSELAGTTRLQAYAYEQSARTEVTKAATNGYNVKSGSGGVFDAAAALSQSTIRLNTQSLVGNNAKLHLIGDFRAPQNLLIHAFNSVFARDSVKLDSGGAIAVAKADSMINVDQAIARVTVGQGADLSSIGDIILSASGSYDIDARSNAKTWGLAGAAMGYSQARVNADYDVILGANSTLLGYGDIRLYAGQNANGSSSQATLTARTDLWNNTAFPVVNDPNADAVFLRDSAVTVNTGSQVNSIGDIFAHADKGYGNLLGKGVAKDLYTEALNALGLSVEITSGSQVNSSNAVVKVDGALSSGYYNKRSVHITGLEYWVNGTKMTLEQISALDLDENSTDQIVIKPIVTTSDGDITFRLKEGTYSQYISQRVEQLNGQLTDYGLSPVERSAMQAELNVLQRTLDALFAEMGGDASEGASLSRDQIIQVFELDPILAKPGNVHVIGDALIGSGSLRAPGDAAITVTNDSSAFLRIMGLEIPFREGGQLLFNQASLTSSDAINNANTGAYKGQASFSNVTVSSNSPDPVVTVVNNYNPSTGVVGQDGLRSPAPDIYIDGRIFNQRGLVTITASYGSIYANADIRGKTLQISAGRDFVLNAEDAFFHVGGDPATNNTGTNLTAPAAGSGVVAGNNVVISAQYLNINGLIQSGVANWTASILDSGLLKSRIDLGRTLYQLGYGEAVISLQATDARTGTLGYSYDLRSESIVLDAVEVAGGYMELTGYILSTGNGQLSVLDGYSQVGIVNTSDYTLSLSGIDLGTGTKGTLRINDARRDGNGNEYVWSSIYTRGYDAAADAYKVYLQQGLSNAVLTATAVDVGAGRNTTYNPVTGRSYVWLTGQDQTETTISTYYKDKFWGAFNVGDGTLYGPPIIRTGDPRPIDGADYMGAVDGSLTAGEILGESETFDTGDAPNVSNEEWTSCEKWFLWCQVKRSWLRTTSVQGQKVVNRYTVRADNPVNISFIGSDIGAIDLDSKGSVVLLGSLFNQNGTTNITTDGSLTQGSSGAVIQAANLNLQTGTGIGSDSQAVTVQVGDLLSAKSTSGDVNLRGLGAIKLSALEALRGNVALTAQGNITAQNSAVTIKGHAINLATSSGSIGSAGNLLNIDTDTSNGSFGVTPATLKASAVGGIYLREITGNLLVDQVQAGGDVHIKVANGDLVDANTALAYDERTLDELKALWADMGLTGQAAADALEEQKSALISAGQNSYERYWNLRIDKGTGSIGVFDLEQVKLSTAQVTQLKSLDWSDAQIAAEQTRINAEYDQLHTRFGGGTYDASYQYQLSTQDTALLDNTAAWSEEQLQYSISSALLSRGTNTQAKVEDVNIQGANVTLDAYRVGQVLAEDMFIDLGVGIENLSKEQLAALAGAELDDVYFDDLNDKTRMRIVQRDDVNVAATGNLDVTAIKDVYLGGKSDFNIYNVQGDTVRIKTDGNIESANGSNVVISGHDVVLEASNGAIGGQGAVHINVSGDLIARAVSLNLAQAGDLRVLRLTGSDSINLELGGNLIASGQNGEHLLGGAINLDIAGDLGRLDDRIQMNSQTDEITLNVGGGAWVGAMQGVIVQPGNLNLGSVVVVGLLGVAQATSLTQTGDWSLGSLLLSLGSNWRMDVGSSVTARDSLNATMGSLGTLGDLAVTGSDGELSLSASQLVANDDDIRWVSADRLALETTGAVGGTGNIGQSTRHVILQARELDVDASGQLFLDFEGGFERGNLISLGNQSLNSLGSSALTRIESTQGMITLRGLGELEIGQLQAMNDLDLAGSGMSLKLGTLRSQQGSLMTDIGGLFGAETVDAQNGFWNLKARQALVGEALIAGPVNMLIVEDLQLDLLNAGNDVDMLLGSASHIGELDVAGSLDLAVAGLLDLKLAKVDGDARLHHSGVAGTPLRYTDLQVDRTLSITGAGEWTGGTGVVGGDVTFDVGTADLGSLESLTGTVLLNAKGLFAVDQLHGRQQWVNLTSGSAELGDVSAQTQLTAETNGDLSIATGRSGSDMSLTTVAGSLGTIRFGTLADPDAPNGLTLAHLKSDENLLVRTDGDVFGGNAEAEQLLTIEGRNLYFGRVQSLQGDVSLLGSGDYMDGNGNITGLLLEAFRDVGVIAGGNLTMPEVKFGGTYSLKAGRDLTVGVRGDLNVQGEAEAGRDLFFDVGRNVDLRGAKAGRDVTVNAGGAINFDDRVEAGGNVLLNAKGGNITVGGPISSSGTYDGNSISGKIQLNATGDITTVSIGAASLVDGNISVEGQNLSLGNLVSSANIDLLARGAIQVNNSSSAGNQTWFADGDIGFQRLLAQGQAVLDSLLDTRGQSIRADQGITAAAGWRDAIVSPATLEFEEAIAPTMTLRSGQSIRVEAAGLGESADLYAQQIEFNGQHTGEGLLTLTVQGLNNAGQPGDSFQSRFEATHMLFDLLDMVRSDVDTTALLVDFLDAKNVDYLSLTTPQAVIIADNVDPTYRANANVQLHELDKAFWLQQNGLGSYTNGYVIHRDFTHQVRVPNFAEGHEDGNVDYQNISAADYSVMMMTPQNIKLRLGQLMNQMAGYVPPVVSEISSEDDEGTVNMDWQAFSEQTGNGANTWGI